jgi:hypothetical protein
MVFGSDIVLDTKFKADRNYIRDQKKKCIEQNNTRENATQKQHNYTVGDGVCVAA